MNNKVIIGIVSNTIKTYIILFSNIEAKISLVLYLIKIILVVALIIYLI